ncbi:hypothetical protein BD414DRAFT_479840 [Trametes punicea]|nr:hypothetical protein BD414DRAFT_479840 [Trametes punicea]
MYQHYHTRRSSASVQRNLFSSSTTSSTQPCILSSQQSPLNCLFPCRAPSPIRVQEVEVESDGLAARYAAVYALSCTITDITRRSPRCISRSTAALAPFRPFLADSVQRSFIEHVLPYMHPVLPVSALLFWIALRDEHPQYPLPFIESRLDSSRRLRSILFFTFIVHSSSPPVVFEASPSRAHCVISSL